MRITIRIFLLLISSIIAITSLLFFPPVTSYMSKIALKYVFDKNIIILSAQLTPNRFDLHALIDQNQSVILNAKELMHTNRQATLQFKGNVNVFSHIATVELPYMKATATAVYQGPANHLVATAETLEGKVYLDLDLNAMHYTYGADDVKIESYLQQNDLPLYASGPLFFKGKGLIQDDYYVDINITRSHLFLEDAAVSELSSKIKAPLGVTLASDVAFHDNGIKLDLEFNSSLASISIPAFNFGFDEGVYTSHIEIANHGIQDVPIKHLSLISGGTVSENNHTGRSKLVVDGHVLEFEDIEHRIDANQLKAAYRLSTLQKEPINLTGNNALFGTIDVQEKELIVTLDSKMLKEPGEFSMKKEKISFILNSMPLKMLFNIINQPNLADADLDLDFQADLSQEPLLWQFHTETENLFLDKNLSSELNITRPIVLRIDVKNDKDNILITPFIDSDLATLKKTLLTYHTKTNQLGILSNLYNISLPGYKTPLLGFKGTADLANSTLLESHIKLKHETIEIKNLSWKDNRVFTDFNYKIERLDRFASLNKDYVLSGDTHLTYANEALSLSMLSDQFGPITLFLEGNQIRVNTSKLPLKEIFVLTSSPVMLQGDLNISLLYASPEIHLQVNSDMITPTVELNSTIRPFSLQSTVELQEEENGYFGKAKLKTANEALILENISVKTDELRAYTDYDLNITALENATAFLPKALQGTLQLNGYVEHNKTQKVSVSTSNFALPLTWHRYLDSNASSTLNTAITLDAEYDEGKINLANTVETDLISIDPLNAKIDLNQQTFQMHSSVLTDLWLKDMNISLRGSYDDNKSIRLIDSKVRTASQQLTLQKFHYKNSEDISGSYKLILLKTDDPSFNYHKDAQIEGRFQTAPKIEATLKSESFDGVLDISFDEKVLKVHTKQLSLPLLLAFAGQKTPLETGKIDSDIYLSSAALLENNLTKLSGKTEIYMSDLLINGINLDKTLKHLRDSQDLSLFNKDFKDLPLVRSVTRIPSNLRKGNVETTRITDIQLNTITQNGFVSCDDCALSTEENRVAFQGGINLNTQTFLDFYVSLLDPNGCSYFIQQVEGNLSNPKVELAAAGFKVIGGAALSVASNVTDAVSWGTGAVKKTGGFLGNITSYIPLIGGITDKTVTGVTALPSDATGTVIGDCTPFYTGVILHPVKKQVKESSIDDNQTLQETE